MPFHVFIERPVDATPQGRGRLAAAIADKYRLPQAQVQGFLDAGRFRVKSNVDEATARRFHQELTGLGAIVSVVDASSGQQLIAPAAPPPAPPAATPPPGPTPSGLALAGPAAAAPPKPASSGQFESGLAAAFSGGGGDAPLSLGALEGLGSAAGMSLSSLDGVEEEPPPAAVAPKQVDAGAFMAPDELAEQPLELDGPPPKPKGATVAVAPPLPALEQHDDEPPRARAPVAPPVPIHQQAPLDLATPIAAPPKRATPPPHAAVAPPPHAPPSGTVAAAPPPPAAPRRRPLPIDGGPLARFFVDQPHKRLIAGLALSLLLGFLPAHLWASSAESSRYGRVRAELVQTQSSITTNEQWKALDAADGARAEARRELERLRGRIRTTTGFIWLVVGAGFGFLWFKKLA